MSRRDRNDPQLRKKTQRDDPEQEQEQDQEQVQETEKQQEQARDAAQDQIGNQGIASMLGIPSIKPGEAGLAIDAMQNREEESAGMQFGGEEPPPDGPLTLDDLVRSWNPTTRRGNDTPDRTLGLYQTLPDEDQALLAEASQPVEHEAPLPHTTAIDALLQPPPEILLEDLGPLVRAAARLAEPSLLYRCLAKIASPAAPVLADPHGRLLHTRARTASIATLIAIEALSAQVERRHPSRVNPAALFLLDLAARGRAVDAALDDVRARELRLPLCADVLGSLLQRELAPRGAVALRPMGPGASRQIHATLRDLLDLPPPSALVPSLPDAHEHGEEEDEDDADLLDIDAVMSATLGAGPDALAGIYDAQLGAAEKLAGAAARLRTHAAGMLLAIAQASAPWSSGLPERELMHIATEVDRAVGEVLNLLVEVGRAIQRRAVAPMGIRNGLRRAVRGLEQLMNQIPDLAVPVIGGLLPAGHDLRPPAEVPADPLSWAWQEGEPASALPWLEQMAESHEQRMVLALTRAAAGGREELGPEWLILSGQADASGEAVLSAAMSICACAALMHSRAYDAALLWAERDMSRALSRRNGLWYATSALTALDARALLGQPTEALRSDAARIAWRLSARAGLSILARWSPPSDDDEAEGYTYPWPEGESEQDALDG